MNWENYRKHDCSIDLFSAFRETLDREDYESMEADKDLFEKFNKARKFLSIVEIYQPIRSRQVAAIAISQAYLIYKGE